jgi:hypothetical protein
MTIFKEVNRLLLFTGAQSKACGYQVWQYDQNRKLYRMAKLSRLSGIQNPPHPPFRKKRNFKKLLSKFPFEKEGFRGI